jgi:hypothetical protein
VVGEAVNGRCDAAGCAAKARWYAVARGRRGDEVVRSAFNVSACDGHRRMTVLQLAEGAGFEELVKNLLGWMGVGAEVVWEHIVGA